MERIKVRDARPNEVHRQIILVEQLLLLDLGRITLSISDLIDRLQSNFCDVTLLRLFIETILRCGWLAHAEIFPLLARQQIVADDRSKRVSDDRDLTLEARLLDGQLPHNCVHLLRQRLQDSWPEAWI